MADLDDPHGDGPCSEEHGDERPVGQDAIVTILAMIMVLALAAFGAYLVVAR